MALIEPGNPAAAGTSREYWRDQLKNTRVLLFELDKAILALERNETENYTIDTGQTTVTVRRVNLPELIKQRAALLNQAREIESLLDTTGGGSSFVQVLPW